MISQTQIDHFRKTGIWYTGVPSLDPKIHKECFKTFLSREDEYKKNFLQTKFNTIFEGYSYLGQEDSANQYADDQLYTYVISDFFDHRLHAAEFESLFQQQKELIPKVAALEKELLGAVSPELLDFYNHQTSHSLSANYYPAAGENSLRLTEHPDGSLLTVFPFGMDEEFQYELSDGSWHTIAKTDEIVCFSGYLLECMSSIKALNHKVVKQGPQHERFSFAYFSIPTPGHCFRMKGVETTTEDYFKQYLSLFE